MVVAGIVAEYNPLHNGHLLQMKAARAAGATHIVCVLSGDFVQRAEPAMVAKFARAAAAADCGADLVFELPVQYATASGERFAFGAVSILHRLGCADRLSFGSESGDLARLRAAADAVLCAEVADRTRALCETGLPYPAARQRAVCERCGAQTAAVLGSPNDLLAVEYLKALRALGSGIEPQPVLRVGAAHDDAAPADGLASASFLRRNPGLAAPYLPEPMRRRLREAAETGGLAAAEDRFGAAQLACLRGMTPEAFRALPDCADGLGDRLYKAAKTAQNMLQLCAGAKTRRYTLSRVRRAALAAVLGITPEHFYEPPYARLLAIGPGGAELLRRVGETAVLPVSGSLAKLAALGGRCAETALLEARAADLFGLTREHIPPRGADYTARLYKTAR